jgi:adenine-specific DNA-methyltransferase
MEDYAETITAERVKRVISGYADVDGTGGEFDYYELGEPLFVENNLNPKLPVEKIREYIYFMETKLRLPATDKKDNKYLLGVNSGVAYYFFYNPKEDTELDYAFLKTIKTKADEYIIYADNCLLTTDFLQSKRITFKKIPREIPRI